MNTDHETLASSSLAHKGCIIQQRLLGTLTPVHASIEAATLSLLLFGTAACTTDSNDTSTPTDSGDHAADADSGEDTAHPLDTGDDPDEGDTGASEFLSEGRYRDLVLTMSDNTCGRLFEEKGRVLNPFTAKITLLDSTHFQYEVATGDSYPGAQTSVTCERAEDGAVSCPDAGWTAENTNTEYLPVTGQFIAFVRHSSTSFTHEQLLTVTCDGPTIDGYNECGLIATDLGTTWPCSARMSATFSM